MSGARASRTCGLAGGGADVRWHDASTSTASALEVHVRSLRGPGEVVSGRLCPACGSDRHGRPWLRHDGRQVHVSVSRSGEHLVTAVAAGEVGVDVERAVIEVLPELVRAPGETDDLARAWTRKEAILKARGTGLSTPMSGVVLARERWQDLPAPEGYVAALAGPGVGPRNDTDAWRPRRGSRRR